MIENVMGKIASLISVYCETRGASDSCGIVNVQSKGNSRCCQLAVSQNHWVTRYVFLRDLIKLPTPEPKERRLPAAQFCLHRSKHVYGLENNCVHSYSYNYTYLCICMSI